jgi:predicted ester cyclase
MSATAVVARFWELYNSPQTIRQTAALCAEDCHHEQSTPAGTVQYVGRTAQLERIEQVSAAFADWHVTPLETVSDGRNVASRYAWRGTLKVPFGRFDAGTRLQMQASCFFTVEDGVIVRISDVGGPMMRAEEGRA